MATISRLISKIKETLKSVNKLGLAAILVAGVMALSFKAPERNPLAQKYGYVQATDSWELIDGLTMDNDPINPAEGTYRCDESSEKCTGYFNSAPTSGSDIPDLDLVLGDFSYN